jgi:alpha,alpha-trehalase
MKKYIVLSILLIIVVACNSPLTQKDVKSPDIEFGELFTDVQSKAIFPDSKTFADCTPKTNAEAILKAYQADKNKAGFDLKRFVFDNFDLPKTHESGFKSDPSNTAEQHINALWKVLTRQPEGGGTLVRLRRSYVVPGGRFGEIYYWDSYFTMLGLREAKKDSLIENMVLNFAQLIQDFGHIPNGNRSYYQSRSQPPFFAMMVQLLTEIKKDKKVLLDALPQLQREYYYWMAMEDSEKRDQTDEARKKGLKAHRKAVFMQKDSVTLNRYFDESDTPRPEAYKEDVMTAKKSGRKLNEIYRELRSGAESGWDFSARWFRDGKNLETIHVTEMLPVDLNCLLYNLELVLAEAYKTENSEMYAKSFIKMADKRKALIDKYLWNESAGFYFDYDFMAGKQNEFYSLAGVFPLSFKMATQQQAEKVAKVIESKFLQAGGLTTTLTNSGQQWDAPNGWAPLQWMTIVGLRNYGFNDLANKIKKNWVENNLRVYKNTGKMVEKYNVYDLSLTAGGGEYPVQDGFGWTNGVLLKLLNEK